MFQNSSKIQQIFQSVWTYYHDEKLFLWPRAKRSLRSKICETKFGIRCRINWTVDLWLFYQISGSQVDKGKVYESLPSPELKQEVQKSNVIQETAEQSKESDEEQENKGNFLF